MQQLPVAAGQQGSQTGSGTPACQALRSGGDSQLTSRTSSGRPKKRDRNDSVTDSSKQQRLEKTWGISDIRDGAWKPEASSLVGEDGGLSSTASVERLLCIMRYEWDDSMQSPVDLIVRRTMLSKVVAATSEVDCLTKFLKMGGLSILDQWLQEAHKWRSAVDNNSAEDGEKAMEDLLLALLGTLERLPVDLLALKTCSVGKSVNNLRSHKHQDIQRRARKLVDTWKRRVELEMNQVGDGTPPKLIPSEQSVSSQVQDTVTSSLQASVCTSPADAGNMGSGKFASVGSLCSSHESQRRSTLITASSTSPYSGSISHRVPFVSYSPMNSLDFDPSQLLEHHGAAGHSLNTEGPAKFSSAHVVLQGSYTESKAREAGAARQKRHPHWSKTSTSSVTTSLSVPAKSEGGVLPCSGSSHMRLENARSNDIISRSTLNSATTMDMKETPPSLSRPQYSKSGNQMVANVVASENSMNDAKSPDSLSERSFSAHRGRSLPSGDNLVAQGSHSEFQGSGGISKDREHHDRISSNVSSPSETSMPADNHLSEHKKAHHLAYVDVPSPAETISQSSHPSALVDKLTGSKRGSPSPALYYKHGNFEAWNEDGKGYISLPAALVAERVGESNIVCRSESRCRPSNTTVMSPRTSFPQKLVKEASPLSRPTGGGNVLEADREAVAVTNPAAAGKFQGSLPHQRDSPDRLCSQMESTVATPPATKVSSNASALVNQTNELKPIPDAASSPVVAEVMASVAKSIVSTYAMRSSQCLRQQPKGLAFDLNEMVVADEWSDKNFVVTGSVISEQVSAQPTVSSSIPMPMVPIAVMAAVKGPPSIPCRSSGDLGWKGSAATSAFRPTQPRQSIEKPYVATPGQKIAQSKALLDFDLNVAISSLEDDDTVQKVDSLTAQKLGVNINFADVKSGARFCSRAGLDLNQMDEFTGSGMDLDLNNGPVLQRADDVTMPAKRSGMRDQLLSSATAYNTSRAHTFPDYPPIIPLTSNVSLPSSNPNWGYAAVATVDSGVNSAPHPDAGIFPRNIFMQNQIPLPPSSMVAYPASQSSTSYGNFPSGLSAGSLHGFRAPFLDRQRPPPAGATALSPTMSGSEVLVQPQVMLPFQLKPPYMMGMSSDAI